MPRISNAQRQDAMKYLRELLPAGARIFTTLEHVSRSGMLRHVKVLVSLDGEVRNISPAVATVTGYRRTTSGDAVKVGGCGFDAGFQVAYDLGRVLFPGGVPCTGDARTCRSNDHSNGMRDYPAGHLHTDGGYAFRHAWV